MTVKVTRGSTGNIKRLTAAVVVNAPLATPAGGDAATAASAAAVSAGMRPLSAQQQEQLLTLVRETLGYSADRGDSVNLVSAPFMDSVPVPAELPVWKDPEVQAMAKSMGVPIALALFGALVLLGLVRPALKGGAKPKPTDLVPVAGGQLNALEAEEPDRPALPAPVKKEEVAEVTPEQLRLEEARVLAKSNPVAVANILKTWVHGDGA